MKNKPVKLMHPLEIQVMNTVGRWKKKGWSNFEIQTKDLKAIVVFEKGKKKKFFGGQAKTQAELDRILAIFEHYVKQANEQQKVL